MHNFEALLSKADSNDVATTIDSSVFTCCSPFNTKLSVGNKSNYCKMYTPHKNFFTQAKLLSCQCNCVENKFCSMLLDKAVIVLCGNHLLLPQYNFLTKHADASIIYPGMTSGEKPSLSIGGHPFKKLTT